MSEAFDPYRKWLGIPPEEQPPNHYRLLGIALYEDDTDTIHHAADRQMAHLRTFQSGKFGGQSQKLLNEVSAARLCLLDANTPRSSRRRWPAQRRHPPVRPFRLRPLRRQRPTRRRLPRRRVRRGGLLLQSVPLR